MSVFIRYRKQGQPEAVIELHGDPFDICNRVAAGLGLKIGSDPEFAAIMRERAELKEVAA